MELTQKQINILIDLLNKRMIALPALTEEEATELNAIHNKFLNLEPTE